MLETIGELLKVLFPEGTGKDATHAQLPEMPASVFGATAYLLERGGVYHKLVSEDFFSTDKRPFAHVIKKQDVDDCCRLGRLWLDHTTRLFGLVNSLTDIKSKARKDKVEKEIEQAKQELKVACGDQISSLWTELTNLHAEKIIGPETLRTTPKWWLPALKLLIISDEASVNLGYAKGNPFESLARTWSNDWRLLQEIRGEKFHFLRASNVCQFERKLNRRLVRVIPKSRTPTVGCTMRTLSHNLAIVPPEGIVDINWFREPYEVEEDATPLNLLLVPFPYKVSSQDFSPILHRKSPEPSSNFDHKVPKNKGMFEVQQLWLQCPASKKETAESPRKIADFVNQLVESAAVDCGKIHGIVFPELSMNWSTYAAIIRNFSGTKRKRQALDLCVAGISSLPDGTKGNFAATTTFVVGKEGKRYAISHMRAKHHRWQLNASQITDYALGANLDPNSLWWEGIDIPPREIDLSVMRGSSIFTAMICEDLARSEPCHEPLRSVGPNLVFVLLMDGAQIPNRWPARYATALADDPGSSVLTLTSLGLMQRTNNSHRYSPLSRHIAIWKDDTGSSIQIECPNGSQAVLLTIVGEQAEECTLDGRPNWDAQAWRYRGHQPVKLPASLIQENNWNWIVE